MTPAEMLRRYGTIAFSSDVMLQTIGSEIAPRKNGWPCSRCGYVRRPPHHCPLCSRPVLQFEAWLQIVPEAYRLIALRASERVASSRIGFVLEDDTEREIIWEVQAECLRALEAGG